MVVPLLPAVRTEALADAQSRHEGISKLGEADSP